MMRKLEQDCTSRRFTVGVHVWTSQNRFLGSCCVIVCAPRCECSPEGSHCREDPPYHAGKNTSTVDISCLLSLASLVFLSRFQNKVVVVIETEVIHGLNFRNFPSPRKIGCHHCWLLKIPAEDTHAEPATQLQTWGMLWHGQPPAN